MPFDRSDGSFPERHGGWRPPGGKRLGFTVPPRRSVQLRQVVQRGGVARDAPRPGQCETDGTRRGSRAGSASPCRPVARYSSARLFSGWRSRDAPRPGRCEGSPSTGDRAARPRRDGPSLVQLPPGCSARRRSRDAPPPGHVRRISMAAAVERLGLAVTAHRVSTAPPGCSARRRSRDAPRPGPCGGSPSPGGGAARPRRAGPSHGTAPPGCSARRRRGMPLAQGGATDLQSPGGRAARPRRDEPIARYSAARLFSEVGVVGMPLAQGRAADLHGPDDRAARPRRDGPSLGTAPPGCSARWRSAGCASPRAVRWISIAWR